MLPPSLQPAITLPSSDTLLSGPFLQARLKLRELELRTRQTTGDRKCDAVCGASDHAQQKKSP
jgi:hypothetical protein